MRLEEERQALAAFVKKFDALSLSSPLPPTKLNPPMPTPGGAAVVFAERQRNRLRAMGDTDFSMSPVKETESPIRVNLTNVESSLLDEQWDVLDDLSFEIEKGSKFMPGPLIEKENLRVQNFGEKKR